MYENGGLWLFLTKFYTLLSIDWRWVISNWNENWDELFNEIFCELDFW